MVKILEIRKASNPKTPFCFNFNYFIYEDIIKDIKSINVLKKIILKKEKIIIKNTPFISDYGTGVGKNSLTSRFSKYNLLDWKESIQLKKIIKLAHDNFLKILNLPIEKNIFVQCWANVLRKKEQIKQHEHSTLQNNYAYLGGHFCINVKDTSTHYVDPVTKDIISSKNEIGKITLFPSWLSHYTDEVINNEERITIAFDIANETVHKEDIKDSWKNHWVKL